jgi:hypothetical protein
MEQLANIVNQRHLCNGSDNTSHKFYDGAFLPASGKGRCSMPLVSRVEKIDERVHVWPALRVGRTSMVKETLSALSLILIFLLV